MSSSTVYLSYQYDARMIIKGCVQWNPIYEKIWPRARFELGTARSEGERLPTELSELYNFVYKIFQKIIVARVLIFSTQF